MADSRLEDIGCALRAKGVQETAIQVVLQAWEPSTTGNYDLFWRRWAAHAKLQGKDPLVIDESLLSSWLAVLITDRANSEGTVEKAKSVVRSACMGPGS